MVWRDIYTKGVYTYIKEHNGQTILLRDIMEELNITYPTIRDRVKKLIKMGRIEKNGRKFKIVE